MRSRFVLVPVLVAGLALSACSGDSGDDVADATTTTSIAATTTTVAAIDKPAVTPPADPPADGDEVRVTALIEGTGPEVNKGATVAVFYVGVQADGTEFDTNYGTNVPFEVVNVGQAQVITGWNEGLIGVKQGGRYQLDIPADKAYGTDASSGRPTGPLTFVVDIVSVERGVSPEDEPTVSVAPAANRPSLKVTELVKGTGPEINAGDTITVQVIVFNATTGERLLSTWETGEPTTFTLGERTFGFNAIEPVLTSMNVGGRKQIHLPYLDAYGEDGDETLGLPAMTDVILVVDVTDKQ